MRNTFNIFSIALLLMMSANSIFSQTTSYKERTFGLRGGMTMSKMTFKPTTIAQEMKNGLAFGVAYRYIEEKHFGIQVEFNYTQRGWKETLEDYPELYFDRTLNYIEVPFLSHIYFGNNKFRGFINLGPQIGYFISGSKNTNITEADISSGAYETAQQNLDVSKKLDYGILGGGGIELRFGKHSFLVEGRYYFGLGDIFPNDKKDEFETSSNQTISVAATYFFRLK
ncbi:MAG: porin family protein [Bacteroidales bacterium]|nr:porin family protein [Bacteroidales bacterium]